MTRPTMPELPAPAVAAVYADGSNTPAVKHGFEMGGYMKSPNYFTAAQMLAYGELVREACIAACVKTEDRMKYEQAAAAARLCAEAIRSMGSKGNG